MCFLVALCRLIVRRPNLEVATKSFSISYFWRCEYFWGPWMPLVTTDEFLMRSQKLLQRLVSHELTTYLSIFNLFKLNELRPYYQKHVNFESHNSLKPSFTNIWGIRSNLVDCESFLESISPDAVPLGDTNLDDSTDSGNFFVRGYLPLIWKDSSTHMQDLAVYVKEGSISADSYLCFRLALIHSLSYFFFLCRSLSLSLCKVFDSIPSNIDEVLSINPPANAILFGEFNVHQKDWFTYFGETDRSKRTLLTQLTFPLRSQTVILTVLIFWINFFLLTTLMQIGTVFVIICKMFHGRISLNCLSAAASEFCEWIQVGTDVYIPYRKY